MRIHDMPHFRAGALRISAQPRDCNSFRWGPLPTSLYFYGGCGFATDNRRDRRDFASKPYVQLHGPLVSIGCQQGVEVVALLR